MRPLYFRKRFLQGAIINGHFLNSSKIIAFDLFFLSNIFFKLY